MIFKIANILNHISCKCQLNLFLLSIDNLTLIIIVVSILHIIIFYKKKDIWMRN